MATIGVIDINPTSYPVPDARVPVHETGTRLFLWIPLGEGAEKKGGAGDAFYRAERQVD